MMCACLLHCTIAFAKSRLTIELIDVADVGVGEWKRKVFDGLVVIDPSRIVMSEKRRILSGVVEYIHAIERRMRSARQARRETSASNGTSRTRKEIGRAHV